MNVLFLTTAYPTTDAPAAGIFVREHARAAAEHANVAVVHLDRRQSSRIPFTIERAGDDIPVWRVRYPRRPMSLSLAGHVAGAAAAYLDVRRSGFRPDLLHAHFFLAAGPARLISLATGTPYVASEHWTAFLPEDPTDLGRLWRFAARTSLAGARFILPVSKDLEQAMLNSGIRGRYCVVPNAVDVALFRPGLSSSHRLLTVGMLTPQKGIDVLVRALSELPADVALDIVGDGGERTTYERLVDELGLTSRVSFHGMQPKERIAAMMGEATLFVLASRFDNNPCVLIEAQASGLPIVATQVGGIPEIVDGDGVLVQPDDPEALTGAIREALSNPQRWDRDAIAARARTRYSLDVVGDRLAEIYRSALA